MPNQEQETPFYQTGGTLPANIPSYVTRSADGELLEALSRGEFCYVLNTRQMGKSSLIPRAAEKLRAAGNTVAIIDFSSQEINRGTEDAWYDGILLLIAEAMEMEEVAEEYLSSHSELQGSARLFRPLRRCLLQKLEERNPGSRLIVFVDEIDSVLSLPFSTDPFFAGIRAFSNQRTQDPLLDRIAFCLLGVATPNDLIRDTRTTPFNIGRAIQLFDFTLDEARPLEVGFSQGEKNSGLLERVLYWTGGHPYLTHSLCKSLSLAQSLSPNPLPPADVDRLCRETFLSQEAREREVNFTTVRNRILFTNSAEIEKESGEPRVERSEEEKAALLNLYEKVLASRSGIPYPGANTIVDTLRLAGLVRISHDKMFVSNRIYETVFDRRWVREAMPGAAKRREAEARRKGFLSAVPLILLFVALAGAALFYAFKANEQQTKLDGLYYTSNIYLVQQIANSKPTDFTSIRERLDQTKHSSDDFEWMFWNTRFPAPLVLYGHTDAVTSVCFSPDGKKAATTSADKTTKILDTLTGQEILSLSMPNVFAPSGESTNMNMGEEFGTKFNTIHTKNNITISSSSFSPNGKQIVIGFGDHTAGIFDATSGIEKITLLGHTQGVTSVRFSSDGKWVVTGSDDRTAKVWDASTGIPTHTLTGHMGSVVSVCFSPDGSQLVTGSGDYTAKIWNSASFKTTLTLKGHSGTITSMCFSPDGSRIATGSSDRTIKIWNPRTGVMLHSINVNTGFVTSICYSPDGSRIVAANIDGTTKIWTLSTGLEIPNLILNVNTGYPTSVCFSPDGNRILAGYTDGLTRVWYSNPKLETATLKGHTGYVTSACFSPDGSRIVTGSEDWTAKIWDALSGNAILTFNKHSGKVTSVAFAPNGKWVVTGSGDFTAKVWDGISGRVRRTLIGHMSTVTSVCFSPDGTRIVTGSNDKTAKVWDTASGQNILTLRTDTDRVLESIVTSVCMSPDGARIVTGYADNMAKVWDAGTGQVTATLSGHTGRVTSVCFSPDGNKILTGSADKTARVWDSRTGNVILPTFTGHSKLINFVGFSPNGKKIITGSEDNTSKIWDVNTGQETLTLTGHYKPITSASFSSNGKRVITGSRDNTAKIWDASTVGWLQKEDE